jgi:hypothetical protein
MKTNQIITLGLVAVGAVIVYNKFFKKPKTTSAPAEGETLEASGKWENLSKTGGPRIKTLRKIGGGLCEFYDSKTGEYYRGPCN